MTATETRARTFNQVVTSMDQLRGIIESPKPDALSMLKEHTELDAHCRAFVAQGHTYWSVNLATGDRTIVSQYPDVGTGGPASSVQIEWDAAAARLLVGTRLTPTTFVSIDPARKRSSSGPLRDRWPGHPTGRNSRP